MGISNQGIFVVWGRYELLLFGLFAIDLDWIIILFYIHLNAFRVENVEESTHRTIFTGGIQVGKTHFETFRELFEASNDIFLG